MSLPALPSRRDILSGSYDANTKYACRNCNTGVKIESYNPPLKRLAHVDEGHCIKSLNPEVSTTSIVDCRNECGAKVKWQMLHKGYLLTNAPSEKTDSSAHNCYIR